MSLPSDTNLFSLQVSTQKLSKNNSQVCSFCIVKENEKSWKFRQHVLCIKKLCACMQCYHQEPVTGAFLQTVRPLCASYMYSCMFGSGCPKSHLHGFKFGQLFMICSHVLQLDQSIYLKSCSGPTIYLLSGGGGGGFLKKIRVIFKKP